MKNTFFLFLCGLVTMISLFSCSKHDAGSTRPIDSTTPPVLGKMLINTSYPDSSKTLTNFELIVSEPGGKLLLDTVVPVNTKLTATLSTNATLVNATTVVYNAIYSQYDVNSYRSVNPSTWTSLSQPAFYNLMKPIPWIYPSQASVVYTNPPALTGSDTVFGNVWMNNYGPGYALDVPYGTKDISYQPGVSLNINYYNYANNSLYLLLPELGLYKFHTWNSVLDTVDLTKMDTAVQLYYTKPPQTNMSISLLRGFLDTTNLLNTVQLFAGPYSNYVDVEYPAKGVQAYEYLAYGGNTSKEFFDFYFYGPGMPATMPFPSSPNYNVAANQTDSFYVQFPGARPSFYFTNWVAGSANLAVYASPDSGVIHPATLLTSLNSKLLSGQNIGNPVAQNFTWERLAGLDYAGALNFFFNPTLNQTMRLNGSTAVTKSF